MSTIHKSDDSNSFSKSWELNIYELNRMPHEIIYDDTEIAVLPKVLQNELMCPICLDILKNTMTTKECLHRFCHDCIITALRAGNKECPTCRKKLVSKRSLRPDPNFDGIISKIYPNREEYDALHEKVLEKLNKKHLTAIGGLNNSNSSKTKSRKSVPASSASASYSAELNNENTNDSAQATSGLSNLKLNDQQNNSSKTTNKRALAAAHSDDSDMESRASTEQSSLHLQNELDELEIILKPHPIKENSLNAKRFLKTTSNATVNHLSKYLFTRLCVEVNQLENANNEQVINDFQIFIGSNEKSKNSFHQLNHNMALEQVIDKYWKLNRPIELFYVYKSGHESLPNGVSESNSGKNGNVPPSSSGLNENGNSNSCSSSSCSN